MLAGTVRGNLTLLQATAITGRWGTARYGRLSGLLAAPVTGTALAGPLGGYPQLFTFLAVISAIGAVLACGTRAPEKM
ncbi:hypothetical protein [Streptomyces sp. IBSBF 2435]|uniref:hypothetical protein n=1 Tax=Streptomyces sp. IBSBF 2435 TaxID=2903531 RepID=UPI003FA7972A